jgi:sensor histidine kinase YesM
MKTCLYCLGSCIDFLSSITTFIVTAYQFTFSNEFKPRLFRHLSFWIFYYIYTIVTSMPGISSKILSDPELYKSATQETLYYLPVYLFSVYFSLYFILPGFLSKKNILFLLLSVCTLLLIAYIGSSVITRHILFGNITADPQDVQTVSMIKGTGEQLIIAGTAIIIKTIKYYYLRDEEYKKLSVQRIYHQLDMMKMKLEPAILLGTLKNIYLDISRDGKNAPKMILQLSDLLSYILYDTDANQVPLKKEINLIHDYTDLKKSIFGDRLNAEVQISGDMNHHTISPLLLLPFLHLSLPNEIQNALESYNSGININIQDTLFEFSVKSNLPFPGNGNHTSKSMLDNALQNLSLKYPNRHLFSLEEIDNGFTLYLELKLNSNETDHLAGLDTQSIT